jgi:hypothetical protein
MSDGFDQSRAEFAGVCDGIVVVVVMHGGAVAQGAMVLSARGDWLA